MEGADNGPGVRCCQRQQTIHFLAATQAAGSAHGQGAASPSSGPVWQERPDRVAHEFRAGFPCSAARWAPQEGAPQGRLLRCRAPASAFWWPSPPRGSASPGDQRLGAPASAFALLWNTGSVPQTLPCAAPGSWSAPGRELRGRRAASLCLRQAREGGTPSVII